MTNLWFSGPKMVQIYYFQGPKTAQKINNIKPENLKTWSVALLLPVLHIKQGLGAGAGSGPILAWARASAYSQKFSLAGARAEISIWLEPVW